jgi:signal transduction histidine kinase
LHEKEYDLAGEMLKVLYQETLSQSQERQVKKLTAKLYYYTENYNPALIAFMDAARLDSAAADTNAWAQSLSNISALHHALRDYAMGMKYADYAYRLKDHITDKEVAFNVLQRLGSALIMTDSLDRALEISRQLTSMTDDPDDLFVLQLNEAVIKDHLKQHDEAIQDFEELLIKARAMDDSAYVADILYNLAYAHYYNNDNEKAFYNLDQYHFVQNELESNEHAEELKELEVKYEAVKKEQEIAELNRTSERKDTILYGSIAGATALLSIALLIIRNLRLKNMSQRKLREEENKSYEKSKEIIALNASLQGTDTERRRVAMELHDGIGVLGSTILLKLSGLKKAINDEKMQSRLEDGLDMLKDLNTEVRNISHALMPSSLSKLGLNQAIEEMVEHVRDSTEIKVKYSFTLTDEPSDQNFQTTVYRMVQELINNTLKYGEATQIQIKIGKADGKIQLDYEDNGNGCTLDDLKSRGNGYHSISSRARFYRGTVDVRCAPGQGIAYQITLSDEAIEIPVGG